MYDYELITDKPAPKDKNFGEISPEIAELYSLVFGKNTVRGVRGDGSEDSRDPAND